MPVKPRQLQFRLDFRECRFKYAANASRFETRHSARKLLDDPLGNVVQPRPELCGQIGVHVRNFFRMQAPPMVKAALDHLARLDLIAKKLHPDPMVGTGDVQRTGCRLKYLFLTDGIIDRGAAAVFRRSDILGQCEALNDQADQRILSDGTPDSFRTAGLADNRSIAHNV
jgi:hypothetical protein